MNIANPAFLEQVRQRQWLTPEDVQRLSLGGKDALPVLRALLAMGIQSRQEVGRVWADGFGLAWIDLESTIFLPNLPKLLPLNFARRHGILPVYQMGNRTGVRAEIVTVAVSDPSLKEVVMEAEKIAGRRFSMVCAMPDEIQDAIEIQYQEDDLSLLDKEIFNALLQPGHTEINPQELDKLAGGRAVSELLRAILLLALKEGASDIHIEPNPIHIRIRLRIDGVMVERIRLSREIHPALISRIKVMCAMDITERRKPQDGRLSLDLPARTLGFRVSVVPAMHGEKAVLRVLGELRNRDVPELSELFLASEIDQQMREVISSPNGVFFITGPTGSGKTTTLFSALRQINKSGINIMTIEDPVEYRLPGINQVQVNIDGGLTFATALRAFLRQDPDVILIGEIRDLETARIATEAALTGHLVLSTLHANDAVQAVTRLIEIGVEPFLVGPSIIAIIAQRLVRRVCESCKESYVPEPEVLDRLFHWDGKQEVFFARGKGCSACKGSGYRGRVGIHELMLVNEEIRRLVMAGATAHDIREAAHRAGYRGIRYDGIKKVLRGITTLEEVDRVAPWD